MSTVTPDSSAPRPEHHHTVYPPSKPDVIVKDVVFWRRKTLSIIVLLVSTATWIALEIYDFSFVTVVSWAGICLVALMFIVGNIYRILNKDGPDMTRLEIDERHAIETARTVQRCVEEVIRWMFRMGVERDLFAFAITVAWLWLLSWISSLVDSLTLVYIGVISGLIIPVIYIKYEHKVKEYGCRLRMQGHRYYEMIKDKLNKMKKRVAGTKKEKKTE